MKLTPAEITAAKTGTWFGPTWGFKDDLSPEAKVAELRGVKFEQQSAGNREADSYGMAEEATLAVMEWLGIGTRRDQIHIYKMLLRNEKEKIFERATY